MQCDYGPARTRCRLKLSQHRLQHRQPSVAKCGEALAWGFRAHLAWLMRFNAVTISRK
jgi:hypothetical protein